jgi:hypothetical protein
MNKFILLIFFLVEFCLSLGATLHATPAFKVDEIDVPEERCLIRGVGKITLQSLKVYIHGYSTELSFAEAQEMYSKDFASLLSENGIDDDASKGVTLNSEMTIVISVKIEYDEISFSRISPPTKDLVVQFAISPRSPKDFATPYLTTTNKAQIAVVEMEEDKIKVKRYLFKE